MPLHKTFEKFINALALVWVTDSTLKDIALSIGITPSEWPDCKAKRLVLKYESLWPQEGYTKARRELSSEIQEINKTADTSLYPSDINKLRASYDTHMFTQKAFEVGNEICENPDKAFDIFSRLNSPNGKRTEFYDVAEISQEHFERLCKDAKSNKLVRVIPDWPGLSNMIGGFNPGRIGMILAESGYGKSNFCLNLALSAQKEMRVLYFNMEMLIEDMMDRVHVVTHEMTWSNLRSGQVPVYSKSSVSLVPGNFIMSDGVDKSLDQIRLTVQRFDKQKKVGLVVIDYDQKIILKTDAKTQEWKALQEVFEGLEAIAKEYRCYVLVAAQSSTEDGKVSGSLRSKFPCSSVLFFHKHPEHEAIVSIKKIRFGDPKQYLKVDYSPQSSSVKEKELIHDRPKEIKLDRSVAGPKRTLSDVSSTYSISSRDAQA